MKANPNGLGHPHEAFRAIGELPNVKRRRLNLVSRESLTAVLRRAADRALEPYENELRGRTLFTLRAALLRELVRGLRKESRTVLGMNKRDFLAELERSRDGIVAQSRKAKAELETVQAEVERQRRLREIRKDSAELVAGLEAQLEEIFAKESGDPEKLKAAVLAASKKALGEAASQLADEAESDKRIAQLERRITKLNSSLQNAEALIQRLASMKDVETGVASIYRSVQGLSLEGDQVEAKKEMLKSIFDANVELRQDLRRAS
jgi:hypothetical protein